MDWEKYDSETLAALDRVLGYLNLSNGTPDPHFLAGLDHIFQVASPARSTEGADENTTIPRHANATELLLARLEHLAREGRNGFSQPEQARRVLQLLQDKLWPAYREFHSLLLGHQSDDVIGTGFMWGRFCEAILRQGPPWDRSEEIVSGALQLVNDFVGHRPVPNLEGFVSRPYPHEMVRPVPIYIRGAGVATCRYRELIALVLDILRETDERLLDTAHFDLDQLEELAFDPRAYDFDHPVHHRPGYQFGEWDPHAIGPDQHYHRFVIRQEMLDIVLERVGAATREARPGRMLEAAAVTAGSILVASGVSGRGPEAHDSSSTFQTLIPRLARCRDAFYIDFLSHVGNSEQARLQEAATADGQPFNSARQHLNETLSRQNGVLRIRTCLAEIFARLGYFDASKRQVEQVPVASARVRCDITRALIRVDRALNRGNLDESQHHLRQAIRTVRSGIDAGAIVDPRNILGFDCHFSLFPAIENSIFDHRIEVLLDVVHHIFRLGARIWSEAAAKNETERVARAEEELRTFADWWHTFAAHEVGAVDSESAQQRLHAAANVADVVSRWVRAGAAAGDVAFWAPHAEMFHSPQAYVHVIDVLLKHRDPVASMGLLMHWLGNDEVALERTEASFGQLAHRWLGSVLAYAGRDGTLDIEMPIGCETTNWQLVAKFFDYLEANSSDYWHAPELTHEPYSGVSHFDESIDDEEGDAIEADDGDDDQELFAAAYDGVVYQDSSDDGVEGSIFDGAQEDDRHFDTEAERLASRLLFLYRLAGLWKTSCMACFAARCRGDTDDNPLPERFGDWVQDAAAKRRGLRTLVSQLKKWPLPDVSDDPESLGRFDHRRAVRDSLLEQCVATISGLREAELLLRAYNDPAPQRIRATDSAGFPKRDAVRCLEAILSRADRPTIEDAIGKLLTKLRGKHLIHRAIQRGGSCRQGVTAHTTHAFLRMLVWHLPRLSLVGTTCRLLETLRRREARAMGQPHTISHFNRLYDLACRSIFETAAEGAKREGRSVEAACEEIETIAESLLIPWVRYSRSLRLSVVERYLPRAAWEETKEFIEQYGADLFTKDKVDLGLLRGILYQGIGSWFENLERAFPEEDLPRVVREARESDVQFRSHARALSGILEVLVENFEEYCEFHTATSKADRGELTYLLIDFLRLRCEYRRVAWNLWPYVLAHAALVRSGLTEVADLWQTRLAERVDDRAQHFMSRLSTMEERYGVSLASIRDTIGEQFVRPMRINRTLGLARRALNDDDQACDDLEAMADQLLQECAGSPRDIPDWLDRLWKLTQPDEPHTTADLAVGDVGNLPVDDPPRLSDMLEQVVQWRGSLKNLSGE